MNDATILAPIASATADAFYEPDEAAFHSTMHAAVTTTTDVASVLVVLDGMNAPQITEVVETWHDGAPSFLVLLYVARDMVGMGWSTNLAQAKRLARLDLIDGGPHEGTASERRA